MSLENVRKKLEENKPKVIRTSKHGRIVERPSKPVSIADLQKEQDHEIEERTGHSMKWLLAHGYNENSDIDEFLHE